ncbi:Interleukin-17F, partial, partial [Pelobates cultripes]
NAVYRMYGSSWIGYKDVWNDCMEVVDCVTAGTLSLSLAFLYIDVEFNRYPSRIAIAKCRHQRCVDADGKLMHSRNSAEIKQEILVVYREMKDCKPTYRLQKKLITVGCTCTHPGDCKAKQWEAK